MKRFVFLALSASVGCRSEAPPEPHPDPNTNAVDPAITIQPPSAAGAPTMHVAQVPVSPDDPVQGHFTLDDATRGLPPGDKLTATIDTTDGKITCDLLADKAPITVANFVGLARGTRPWKDPRTGTWTTNKPAYDNTSFHRIIKGFMIQGGDQKGDGSGEVGYVIPDEVWPGARHDRTGQLCMANRGANTNSAQFFITDAAAAHLDRGYTIFGECGPEGLIHMIAGVATGPMDRPVTPVVIKKITIARSAGVPYAGAPRDAGRD